MECKGYDGSHCRQFDELDDSREENPVKRFFPFSSSTSKSGMPGPGRQPNCGMPIEKNPKNPKSAIRNNWAD